MTITIMGLLQIMSGAMRAIVNGLPLYNGQGTPAQYRIDAGPASATLVQLQAEIGPLPPALAGPFM